MSHGRLCGVIKAGGAALGKTLYLNQCTRNLHAATLERYATKTIVPKSLNSLTYPEISESSLLRNANYVREELPVRLAHGIVEMQRLPYFVLTTGSLSRVYDLYCDAFESCTKYNILETIADEDDFHSMLSRLVSDTQEVIELVAFGTKECLRVSKRMHVNTETNEERLLGLKLQGWIDEMMKARIGRRVLAEHHMALHRAVRDGSGRGSVVDGRCDVVKCVIGAAASAKRVSQSRYGIAPNVKISGNDKANLPFVRAHLEYIMFELLKNGMRATVEHHSDEKSKILQDIGVFIAQGPSQLTIRVSDGGGGLKRDQLDRVFEYGYTTVKDDIEDDPNKSALDYALGTRQIAMPDSPMAGLGFGLPMSRLYARYFGGEMSVVNLEGYGCDVYVTLSTTGHVLENIQV